MRTEVTLARAKRELGKLMARACQGEEIIICVDGQPAVQIVPYEAAAPPR